MNKDYNVCLFGASLDTGNRGVSALAASLIKIIIQQWPDAKISLLVGNRSSVSKAFNLSGKSIKVNIVNYRLSPKAHIQEHLFWIFLIACFQRIVPIQTIKKKIINSNRWLKTIAQADFVGAINGGDSFSDIYGMRRYVCGIMPSIIALLLQKNLILLPQTYGPYNSPLAKYIACLILSRSAHIFSRDRESIEIIRKLLEKQFNQKSVRFCPDVAFIMDSLKPEELNIHPPINRDSDVPLIGFNINGLMYNGGYTRNNMFGLKYDYKLFIHQLIKRVMEQTTAHLLLIPHTYGPPGNINCDPDACQDVMKSIDEAHKNRLHMVVREYDQHEIKGIISLSDFFIGSRMHSCIAALSQGIPAVAVAYSRKFKGVLESIGVGDMVVDVRSSDMETAIQDILVHFKNREKVKALINEKVKTARNQIGETFREILKPQKLK